MAYAYDPTQVEPKWQKKWEKEKVYEVDVKKAKDPFYLLVMFPYPSGAQLHIGHWFQYSIPDSYGRFLKMRGKDVLHPMGFDAFGLPAENYAIKTGVPPVKSIKENTDAMVEQFKRMGVMFDWNYLLNTSTPEYYKWTQWLFLQMFKNKLAYKKLGNVNYCPKDQTVLANEQVWDGKCERCGTEVIQKPLEQWYWQITKYADKLLNNLEELDWPLNTKFMQHEWIGRSEGAEIVFDVVGHKEKITVFSTRPDTIFGATFMALAPEHPLVSIITKNKKEVGEFQKEALKKSELQRKTDVELFEGVDTGAKAINPATGKEIPIYLAEYVLMNYGKGAIMAVPGHDERDFGFASSHDLPVQCVIEPDDSDEELDIVGGREGKEDHRIKEAKNAILKGALCWEGEGTMINSDFLDGKPTPEAKRAAIEWLEKKKIGKGVIQYRLRDWLVSRQRYWGAPIPIVYDPEGNAHPIPEEHLPWILPTDVEFKPTGKSPLTESKEFIARTEKLFGKGWRPEFDTMDTFVCSSFYYLRFLMQGDPKNFVDPELEKKWLPVDLYIGGPEHACMHLIYARFVMMALKDFGYVTHEEPFKKLVHQGLITNKGAKMSKSKGNVVSPDSFVERHGSDVFRMYLMFMGPFTDGGDWSDTGIKGIDRFVQRAWTIISASTGDAAKDELQWLHKTIQRVTQNIDVLHFNTAISALMEFLNFLEKQKSVSKESAVTFAKLIAPLAPHLAEELWETLGGNGFIIDQEWPTFDPAMTVSDTVTIAIQVNGKLRGQIEVAASASQEEVLKAAKAHENVQKFVTGPIKKEVYVKGKLVSLVV